MTPEIAQALQSTALIGAIVRPLVCSSAPVRSLAWIRPCGPER